MWLFEKACADWPINVSRTSHDEGDAERDTEQDRDICEDVDEPASKMRSGKPIRKMASCNHKQLLGRSRPRDAPRLDKQ